MSGIVGIFRRSGAPVELPVLRSLTDFLSFRGPDAQEIWSEGAVGFGHTMLRTTHEAAHERQPAALHNKFCITADVRLDSRAGLIDELRQAGAKFDPAATDPELILLAYEAWREDCVLHLRGDFAFAIWDAPRRSLFCARDHFGIKPFFYAAAPELFLFSNTLACLRLHPEISDELNEAAIGDFLLYGVNCDITQTAFRHIQRLPPAHSLLVSAGELRTRRYWSPPIDGRIRYRRPEEYVDHFRELLHAAVADRLRTSRVAVFLSGGLDSGLVAAMAREVSSSQGGATELRAYTKIFESLFRDEEGAYARKTADALQIPIEFINLDNLQPFDRWQINAPEPLDSPFVAGLLDHHRKIASDCRVILGGDGADNLLYFQMWPYARHLLRRREYGAFVSQMAQFLWIRPFPWRGLLSRVQRLFGRDPEALRLPDFIHPDFVARLKLRQRCATDHSLGSYAHPLLPKAYASITTPFWLQQHELDDPGVTRCNLEFRFPFCDLRIINYLLAIPPFPWHFQKRIVRVLAQGRLPEAVRLRKKTPLAGSVFLQILRRGNSPWAARVPVAENLKRYVERSSISGFSCPRDSDTARMMLRPFCLNFWLQSSALRYNLNPGSSHDDGKERTEEALHGPRTDRLR